MTAKRHKMRKEGRAQEHAHLTVLTGSRPVMVLGSSHAERKSPQSMRAGGISGFNTPGKDARRMAGLQNHRSAALGVSHKALQTGMTKLQ